MAPPFARSRLVATFAGGALGDALGAPIQFEDSAAISRAHPTVPASLDYAGAVVLSDDTQLVLWTAEGLIRAHQRKLAQGVTVVRDSVRDALLRWYVTQEPGELVHLEHAGGGWLLEQRRLWGKRAPDNANLVALKSLLGVRGWRCSTRSNPGNSAASHGTLARSAAFAVVHTAESAFEYAADAAAITHGSPDGYLPAAAYAALLHGLLRDVGLPEALGRVRNLLLACPGNDSTLAALEAPAARLSSPLELGGGWTACSALATVLWLIRSCPLSDSDGFKKALWLAAAHGGNSDTLAALVGQVLGAMHGNRLLPSDWLSGLPERATIERVASDLFDSWVIDSALETDAYPLD
jgi:ADP-ribosylglycohydrolase